MKVHRSSLRLIIDDDPCNDPDPNQITNNNKNYLTTYYVIKKRLIYFVL